MHCEYSRQWNNLATIPVAVKVMGEELKTLENT